MANVRVARARDGDGLVALWAELLEHHRDIDAHWQAAPGAEGAWRSWVMHMLDDPDASVRVWAEPDGSFAGFCTAQIRRSPATLAEPGRCEITDLFVREQARRRGIAAELVRATLDWCAQRGVRRVEARVASRNAEGQAFWRALGFGDFVDVLQRRL